MTKEQLIKYRHKMGFTQQYIANLLGIGQRHYQRYESGDANIPEATATLVEWMATNKPPKRIRDLNKRLRVSSAEL